MTRALAVGRAAAVVVALSAALLVVLSRGMGLLVLALAVGIPLLLALADRPQRGVLLLVALAPFSGLLVLVDGPALLAGWKEALILLTLAATLIAPADARRAVRPAAPGWVIGMAALLALSIASAAATGPGLGLTGLKIGYFYLLVPLILWRCPLSAGERDRLVTILVATGIVTAVYGLAQQGIGAVRLNQMGYEYNTVIRFSGSYLRSFSTFIQPFPFALFLMFVLLVAVPHALDQPRRLRSRLLWAASPVMGLALVFTFVRAAWLGLGVGLLLLGLRRYRQLLLPLPIVLIAVLFLPASVSSAAFSAESSAQRFATWEENVAQVVDHPLGVGIGASGSAAVRAAADDDVRQQEELLLLPDNYYFKVLYDLGVVGLWLFVLVLSAIYGTARRLTESAHGADATLAWAFLGVVAGAAAASFTANLFEIFPVDLLFWTLTGVVTLGGDDRAATPDRRELEPV